MMNKVKFDLKKYRGERGDLEKYYWVLTIKNGITKNEWKINYGEFFELFSLLTGTKGVRIKR